MSDLRPRSNKIKLGNSEYGLRFTLNAIDDIQDHFNIPIAELSSLLKDKRKSFKALKYLLTVLINEDVEVRRDEGEEISLVDEKIVGRYIDIKNIDEMMSAVFLSFSKSLPETEEDDPNAVSEPTD